MISTKELFNSLHTLFIKADDEMIAKIISKEDALKFKLFFVNNKPNVALYLQKATQFLMLYGYFINKADVLNDNSWSLYKKEKNGVILWWNQEKLDMYRRSQHSIFECLDIYEKLIKNDKHWK